MAGIAQHLPKYSSELIPGLLPKKLQFQLSSYHRIDTFEPHRDRLHFYTFQGTIPNSIITHIYDIFVVGTAFVRPGKASESTRF